MGDGKVCATFRDRKRFVDFQSTIEEMIIPEALDRGVHTVELILDNGTTHAPKQLEHWLEHLPVVQEGKLTFHVMWLPTNASWLDQIEIWFSIFQRQLLQPNHFVNLDDLRTAISAFIAYYNEDAKAIKWTYTVEKIEKKLEKRKMLQAEDKHLQLENQKGEQTLKQQITTKAA